MLPAKEFPTDERAIEGFRQRYRRYFEVLVKEPESIYQQVSRHLMPAGIENYLPLFFDETATLFDYFAGDVQLLTLGDLQQAADTHLTQVRNRYEDRRVDPLRPLLAPADLYLLTEQLFAAFKRWPRLQLSQVDAQKQQQLAAVSALPDISVNHKLKQPLQALADYITSAGRVLLSAESEGRREALMELLAKIELRPVLFPHLKAFIDSDAQLGLIVSPLAKGCILHEPKLSIICETELFGQRISQQRRREKQRQISSDALIKNLAELKVGQPIVHLEHGVASIRGWKPWIPEAWWPNTSSWNTPVATNSMCLCRHSTSSAATPWRRMNPPTSTSWATRAGPRPRRRR